MKDIMRDTGLYKDAKLCYHLKIPNPHSHYFEITIEVNEIAAPFLRFIMPVWAPGSYLVREFARHVTNFHAESSGKSIRWKKINKYTWEINTGRIKRAKIKYLVYAYEPSAKTSFVDAEHATINGSSAFMYVEGRMNEPIKLFLYPLSQWQQVSTSLSQIKDLHQINQESSKIGNTKNYIYIAENYNEFVDSPIEMGNHITRVFFVKGTPHEVAVIGPGNFSLPGLLKDTKKIVQTATTIFGEIPYERYLFIMHMFPAWGGGLEHKNSTLLQFSRWKFEPREEYKKCLSLIAHEYFHCWNVKRLYPYHFSYLDYTQENYTPLLWLIEGITSYYDEIILSWAGLVSQEEYLETVARDYKDYLETPGRFVQSLEEASFDAWIKYYRQNENSKNSAISYYLKGGLVGLCLDLEIRHLTNGKRSLNHFLRQLYSDYCNESKNGNKKGYTTEDVCKTVNTITGKNLDWFFKSYISGTKELELDRFLGYAGFKLVPKYLSKEERNTKAQNKETQKSEAQKNKFQPYLGIERKKENGKIIVSVVFSDSPAMSSGLYVGDEILAIDGIRVDESNFNARIMGKKPKSHVKFIISRNEIIKEITAVLGVKPQTEWVIKKSPKATQAQKLLYKNWLKISWSDWKR